MKGESTNSLLFWNAQFFITKYLGLSIPASNILYTYHFQQWKQLQYIHTACYMISFFNLQYLPCSYYWDYCTWYTGVHTAYISCRVFLNRVPGTQMSKWSSCSDSGEGVLYSTLARNKTNCRFSPLFLGVISNYIKHSCVIHKACYCTVQHALCLPKFTNVAKIFMKAGFDHADLSVSSSIYTKTLSGKFNKFKVLYSTEFQTLH